MSAREDEVREGEDREGEDRRERDDDRSGREAEPRDDRSREPHEQPEKSEKPRKKRWSRRKRVAVIAVSLVALVLIISVATVVYLSEYRPYESTDDAFIDGHVTPVSAKVAAHVVTLSVDDDQDLNAGDVIVELDPRDFEARLAQARAQLEASRSKLAQANAGVARAEADLEAADAEVVAAEAEAERSEIDRRRYEAAGTAATRQSQDNARAQAASTEAQLRAARKKVVSARSQVPYAGSQVEVARAEIVQSEAQVREAELQLSYTVVRAPVAGRVTRRSVEKGAYVQPGEPMLALVEKDVWVTANFRETQLTLMRPGQPVTISIDAFPDRTLRGHVEGIMRGTGARFSLIPPENATGNYVKVVQRVPVKILFDDPLPGKREVGVGLSVVPSVRVR